MATAYIRRQFNGAAVKTTLTGSTLSSSGTTFSIAASTGWPDGSVGPFIVCVNRGNATEEKILVNSRSGLTLTTVLAQRGYDGTSAAQHVVGETVEIVGGAQDLDEANQAVVSTIGAVTTAGDMLYATGANVMARLAAGTSGQVLVGGTAPAFTGSPSITALTTSGAVTATGEVSGVDVKATGMTGAANQTRLVGRNASGAPGSGTFAVGDMVVNTDGSIWVCTTAGSPGTFIRTTASLVAAKGDLLVGTAASTLTNLTVGSNGTVLSADSTQTSGVKWTTVGTAMTQLARTVLASPASSFSFTSISGSYNNLLIIAQLRSTDAVNLDTFKLTFNNDTGSNYQWTSLQATGSTASEGGSAGTATTAIIPQGSVLGASATAGQATTVRIEIPEYAATTFDKSCTITYGGGSAVGATCTVGSASGSWASTAAITRVDITVGTGPNFATGSTVTLYGLL